MKTRDDVIRLLKENAYNLYSATLFGNQPPFIAQLHKELSEPQPGDLVMETTTHAFKDRDPRLGIGRLLRVEWEPVCTPESAIESGYEKGEEIPKERATYISLEFDDDREFRWTNANFIQVKEGGIR